MLFVLRMLSKVTVYEVFMHYFEKMSASGCLAYMHVVGAAVLMSSIYSCTDDRSIHALGTVIGLYDAQQRKLIE